MTDYEKIMNLAKEVAQKAYAPYSNFKVGACVLSQSGKTYTGCNFENSSYGLSICAERNAIGSMIADGESKIKAIAIYSPNMENCAPCGACRQVIYEFRSQDGTNVLTEINGEIVAQDITNLLPGGFSL